MAQISFTGNIAKPDLKFSKAGKAYFTFSVAENHRRKDQAGQWVESGTTWRRVTFFGNALFTPEALAEAAVQGSFVLVEGREETTYFAGLRRQVLPHGFVEVARISRDVEM